MRERRRQFGLPLPIADKVLPFRPGSSTETPCDDVLLTSDCTYDGGSLPELCATQTALADDGRVAEAFAALERAEQRGAPRRALDRLEDAYLVEMAALVRAVRGASGLSPKRSSVNFTASPASPT